MCPGVASTSNCINREDDRWGWKWYLEPVGGAGECEGGRGSGDHRWVTRGRGEGIGGGVISGQSCTCGCGCVDCVLDVSSQYAAS